MLTQGGYNGDAQPQKAYLVELIELSPVSTVDAKAVVRGEYNLDDFEGKAADHDRLPKR